MLNKILVFLVVFSGLCFGAEMLHVPAAIQIASTVSDGKYSLSEIAAAARAQGDKIVVFADRDFMRWEYGLWPFRGLIKKTVESNSAGQYGFGKYLDEIAVLEKNNPDMVLIAGVESAPFYYWSGSPFDKTLKIHNWHKHLVVVGMEKEEDYKNLPTVSNNFTGGKKFDQYGGERGIGPYQALIDYVNAKGGMAFWTHPDAEYVSERDEVKIETRQYSEDLLRSKDYAGFTVYYDGYEKVGKPGAVWDQVLNEYLEGKRKNPVWAIGGLTYDQTGELSDFLEDLRTVILLPELNKANVLSSLKSGKMYVVLGKPEMKLDRFEFDANSVRLRITGEFRDKIKVNLIKNGKIVKVYDTPVPFETEYKDSGGKGYYRIEAVYKGGMLVSNPVFL